MTNPKIPQVSAAELAELAKSGLLIDADEMCRFQREMRIAKRTRHQRRKEVDLLVSEFMSDLSPAGSPAENVENGEG